MNHIPSPKSIKGIPCISFGFSAKRRLLPLAALAVVALGANPSHAGTLLDIYSKAITEDSAGSVAQYRIKAAEQNVITQKRHYLPRLSALDRELWIYQDIVESGNPVFNTGSADYASNHFSLELDQPLYDSTIQPLVRASKARKQQVQARQEVAANQKTQEIIEAFLRVARFQDLIQSSDRAIARLEKEQDSITKSHDAKIATFTDVQTINLALASLKRERSNFNQQLYYALTRIGIGGEILESKRIRLASNADVASSLTAMDDDENHRPEIEILRAEAAELGHQATAANRLSWPVLSLYSQYNIDKDGGSVFGGSVDVRSYGIGVAVRWDIFNRGVNRSTAKELKYQKMAKEAELQNILRQRDRENAYGRVLLKQSKRNVDELADLVKQHKVLMDAAARAYKEAKDSYLNSITTYLAYEATVREWINARNDLLLGRVSFCAQSTGWNAGLVKKVDALFITSK